MIGLFHVLSSTNTAQPVSGYPLNLKNDPSPMSTRVEPAVRINHCEIGTTVTLESLDGEMFDAFVLSNNNPNRKALTKQKTLLIILQEQIVEAIPLPGRNDRALIQSACQLEALNKLRYRPGAVQNDNNSTAASSFFSTYLPSVLSAASSLAPSPPLTSYGLLVLELKSGKLLKYYLSNPLPCVDIIKRRMKTMGLEGHHSKQKIKEANTDFSSTLSTSTASSPSFSPPKRLKAKLTSTGDLLELANHYLEESKDIERKFSIAPSFELIDEMMDLLRLAVEYFANIPNNRTYQEVISSIQKFLARDDVIEILDQKNGRKWNRFSYKKAQLSSPSSDSMNILLDPMIGTAGKNSVSHLNSPSAENYFSSVSAPRPESPIPVEDSSFLIELLERDYDIKFEDIEEELENEENVQAFLNLDTEEDVSQELGHILTKIDDEFQTLLQSFEDDPKQSASQADEES
jgi:hypothetical protein